MSDMDKLIATITGESKKQTIIAYAGLAISLYMLYLTYKQYKSTLSE